jgi:Chromatin assembly factor 1 subunit A
LNATFLDYEVDSEAEWEEGDADFGEDLEAANHPNEEEEDADPEEGDTRVYDFEDGWMDDDDDIIYEDGEVDEEAKTLRKAEIRFIHAGNSMVDAKLPALNLERPLQHNSLAFLEEQLVAVTTKIIEFYCHKLLTSRR